MEDTSNCHTASLVGANEHSSVWEGGRLEPNLGSPALFEATKAVTGFRVGSL